MASSPAGPYTFLHSIRSNPGIWPLNVLPLHKRPVSDSVMNTYFPGGGFPGDIDSWRGAVARSIWGPWKETGNPCVSADSATTYHSQGTYLLPVSGKKDAFIFMADRWNAENAIDGRYVWLPVRFKGKKLQLPYYDEWTLELFNKK